MLSSGHSIRQRQREITPRSAAPVRRWRAPAEDEHPWWTITFSDLVLLLLCFVVLWHISEKQHYQLLSHSQETPQPQHQTLGATELDSGAALSDLHSQAEVETPQPHRQEMQEPAEETMRSSFASELDATTPPPNESTEPSLALATSPPSPQSVSPALSMNAGWQELRNEIAQYVHEQGLDRTVGVVSTEQGVIVSLSDTITFPPGQARVNAAVKPFLSRVAALASEHTELNIEIAGHTDDRPIATPEFPSNWELSAARASRVARTLLEQEHLDPTRVSTRGFAHYHPLYANDTEEHRAANRRVEIHFFRRTETLEEHNYEW